MNSDTSELNVVGTVSTSMCSAIAYAPFHLALTCDDRSSQGAIAMMAVTYIGSATPTQIKDMRSLRTVSDSSSQTPAWMASNGLESGLLAPVFLDSLVKVSSIENDHFPASCFR